MLFLLQICLRHKREDNNEEHVSGISVFEDITKSTRPCQSVGVEAIGNTELKLGDPEARSMYAEGNTREESRCLLG